MSQSPSREVSRAVVLTGISGVELNTIAAHAERVFRVPVYKFEEYLEEEFKAPIYYVAEILLMYYSNTATRFIKAFNKMLDDIKGSGASKAIIVMHITYHRRRHIIPNPVLHLLPRIAENIAIVNYVDDYYHVLARIADRIVSGKTPSVAGVAGLQVLDPISVLYWRASDHSYSTFYTAGGIEVLQFANKHSVEMHTRLLAHVLREEYRGVSKYRTVYISHPITLVRKRAAEQGVPLNRFGDALDIEEFKHELEAKCRDILLFSPTSIDELITAKNPVIDTVITRETRWPHPEGLHDYPYPVDLSSEVFDTYLYPVKQTVMSEGYLRVVRSLVDAQIESRDLSYVTQADMLIAYRPTLYGSIHTGVEAEIRTAVAQSKPVYAVVLEEDGRHPYYLFNIRYELGSIDDLLNALRCT